MFNSKVRRILLIVTCILILIGIALMAWAYFVHRDKNVIKIKLDIGTSESIKFEELSLLPGESCEYTIRLTRNGSEDKYELGLDFREISTADNQLLKEFAYVKIEAGGETVYQMLLADAFEDSVLKLPVDLKKNVNTELKIVYYLPIDVGNEAQNAEAFFELLLTASNE